MKKLLRILATLSLSAVALAVPQQQGQSQTPPPTPKPGNAPAVTQPRTPPIERVIFLNGKVVMADGSPVPDSIVIDMVCQGSVTRQTHTSRDGSFTLELGSSRLAGMDIADASVGSRNGPSLGGVSGGGMDGTFSSGDTFASAGLGRVDLTNCELRTTSVPGYRSEPLMLGRISVFESNVGNLFLVPRAGVTGSTISRKTLMAPKSAVQDFERGRKELGKKKVDYAKARKSVEKALLAYPDFAEAWNTLGEIKVAQEDMTGAGEAFQKAIALEPSYVLPNISMAQLEMQQNHWAEAARFSTRAVDLNPYVPEGQYLHALSNFQLGNFVAAEGSIHALQNGLLRSPVPLLHYLMGSIHASRKEFPAAAKEYARFLEFPTIPSNADLVVMAKKQLEDWEGHGLTKPQSASVPR